MYPSRKFLTNGIVSLELDVCNGELLAFVREDTKDNAVKNFIRPLTSVLVGIIYVNGAKKHLNLPRYEQIRRDPALTPVIQTEQGDGAARAWLQYPHLVADGEKTDVSATVEIRLAKEDWRTFWSLSLNNPSDYEIESVNFPQINGLWLGDSWENDVLAVPKHVGEKIKNPTAALSAPPTQIYWKWQEYLYTYKLGTSHGKQDDRGLFRLSYNYTGGCSMLWLDLYNETENTGIYLTCRDPKLQLKGICVSTLGPLLPGVSLAITHYPCLKNGQWNSEECIAGFHHGDWHVAADEYRTFRRSIDRPQIPKDVVPQWFQKSVGLMAHYDFQYQNGDIVHTFADIPSLFDRLQAMEMNHLLIAGWHTNGFDNGFPLYRPDPASGTEAQLKEGIDYVHKKGGFVTFYVNSRLCNTAYEENAERVTKSTVMNRDGSRRIERYGAADLEFATLCMNDTDWRNQLVRDVSRLVKVFGADGIYFDQLCWSPSLLCYHPDHKEHLHHPAAWNQGYEKLLAAMHTQLSGTALLTEGCCDVYGKGLSGQLISTLLRPAVSCSPEIYRYTFPDEILTDMLNPRQHSAMRAEVVARRSTFIMYRAFVLGCYFWCYDLEDDNTFERDADQKARLIRTCRLRQEWLNRYGHGTFRDREGLENVGEEQLCKRFDIEGGVLIACADETKLKGRISLQWHKKGKVCASLLTEQDPVPSALPVTVTETKRGCRITARLPSTELALIIIKEA